MPAVPRAVIFTRRRVFIALGGLAVLAVLGAVAWWAIRRQIAGDEPKRPTVFVQKTFRDVRESDGHSFHLERGLACADCHKALRGDVGNPVLAKMDTPTPAACRRCHTDKEVTVHDTPLSVAAQDCTTCHDFAGDRHVKPWGCPRCHTNEGNPAAIQIELHAQVNCGACHDAHGKPSLHPPDCTTCHAEQTTHHGPKGIDGARRCLDCHSAHDTKEAADRRCSTCHRGRTQAPQIPMTATFQGHDKCVNCHPAHEFTRVAARPCTMCHQQTVPVAQHKDCKGCHNPHEPRAAAASCATCHKNVPAPAKGHSCLGCHPPHGPEPKVACASCHGDKQAHAGKLECVSCHTPHSPAPRDDVKLCTRCHAPEVAQVARTHAFPTSKLPAHRDCRACHTDPAHHPEKARPACATCHTEEASTAPKGHADCETCHKPHDGSIKPEAKCVKCHQDRAVGHGTLALGCQTCHQPHAGTKSPAAPPDCLRCHKVTELPGLHQVSKHQTCATCHTAHEKEQKADRATCTGKCHTDRRDHEPTATSCATCHPFGK